MNFNQQNYVVRTCKLLANANRARIIDTLSTSADLTVSALAEKLDMEVNLVSNQLIKLRENGILKARQSGVNMFYEIKDSRVVEILHLLKSLA